MKISEPIFPRHDKSALAIKTGDWRTLRPEFHRKSSVCQANCPAGNRIRDWFQSAKNGKIYEAWQILAETNPFPAVLGRVCPHPCEGKCLRAGFDEALAINAFERFLGDMALKNDWRLSLPQSCLCGPIKRVAIIGAGPAGLTAAYRLRRLGYRIDIFEAEKVPGGMLYLGIPEYRLPKKLLAQEIEKNILSLKGIEVHYGISVDILLWHHFPQDFDAVLIAIGRSRSRKLNISGEDNRQVISGLDFLKKINLGQEADIPPIVAIIGGGNTAIDAARSAKMKGARHVFILYRRREEDMPAFKDEIEAAKKEGVEIIPLVSPVSIEKRCDGIVKIDCVKMELAEADETGRPKVVPISGSQFVAFSHDLIVAIGEEADLSFAAGDDEKLMTGNVFISGDARLRQGYGGQASVYSGGTVAAAIGSGNKVSQEIDFYLRNGARMDLLPEKENTVQISDLNSEYFGYMRSVLRRYPRQLSETAEIFMQDEASRCFSCGDCNSCGNCWLFCPDLAIKETADGKYEIDYDYCKGCGICANECPRNALNMELEVKE